jgi:uncharacterized protein (UPF0264 family)
MAGLLVSVRSALEAEVALEAGAALIDVKEPARGSLGRADDEVIAAVLSQVKARRPVSAALGEFRDSPSPFFRRGLAFVKWGLSGCGEESGWEDNLKRAVNVLQETDPNCRPVAVAYADWQQAQSPPPAAVVELACALPSGAFLIDTWRKDGKNLLDWLTVEEICQLCRGCRRAGVPVALAGALQAEQIASLRPAEPDWFAVRTAACRHAQRNQPICPRQVRRLAQLAR